MGFFVTLTKADNGKGQLISKCLFGVLNFFQKPKENKSAWGIIVVKSDSFVCFLEQFTAWQFAFEFYWPLGIWVYGPIRGCNSGIWNSACNYVLTK